jgi:WhiB family transcriptional regulator, redox-sensing transcriptional regulator
MQGFHMSEGRLNRFLSSMRNADYRGVGWEHYAGCLGTDPELFFPLGNTGPAVGQAEEAKAVCRTSCPVVADCLRGALLRGEGDGVFGGMTVDERKALVRYASRHGVSRDELVGTS